MTQIDELKKKEDADKKQTSLQVCFWSIASELFQT